MRQATPLRRPSTPGTGRVGALVPVAGDARTLLERFGSDPESWLPPPATPLGDSWWKVTIAGSGVTRQVRCHIGEPWDDAVGMWRLITWRPEAPPFPGLDGSIGVRLNHGTLTIVLDGGYRPPADPGEAIDHPALRRLAQSTAHRFVTDIAMRIRSVSQGPAGTVQAR